MARKARKSSRFGGRGKSSEGGRGRSGGGRSSRRGGGRSSGRGGSDKPSFVNIGSVTVPFKTLANFAEVKKPEDLKDLSDKDKDEIHEDLLELLNKCGYEMGSDKEGFTLQVPVYLPKDAKSVELKPGDRLIINLGKGIHEEAPYYVVGSASIMESND